VSAHFFGEGDDDHHSYYLSAFVAGALETWDELEPEVESAHLSADCLSASDQDDAVAPAAPAEVPETSSAHCTVPAADMRASLSPLTNHLPAPSRRDAVTLALAEVAEAPEPRTPSPEKPPPQPVLKIVGGAIIDAIVPTSMREWLFKEHPMDYS
jgi:hypothetical protein